MRHHTTENRLLFCFFYRCMLQRNYDLIEYDALLENQLVNIV